QSVSSSRQATHPPATRRPTDLARPTQEPRSMTSQNLSDLLPDPDVETVQAQCDDHGPFESTVRYPLGRDHTAIRSGCPECVEIEIGRAQSELQSREKLVFSLLL